MRRVVAAAERFSFGPTAWTSASDTASERRKQAVRRQMHSGYRRRKPVRRPKLDGFTGILDAIPGADADPEVPRKQRHTAHRIFEWLRDEHGSFRGPQCRHAPPRLMNRGTISSSAPSRVASSRPKTIVPMALSEGS